MNFATSSAKPNGLVNNIPVCITPSWKTRSLLLSDLVSRQPGKCDDCDLMEKGEKQASTPRHKLSASLCCMIARIPFTWRDRLAVSERRTTAYTMDVERLRQESVACLSRRHNAVCLPACLSTCLLACLPYLINDSK